MTTIDYASLSPEFTSAAEAAEIHGIVENMPPHVYHARPEISKHGLDKIDRAPAKFIHELTQPRTPTPEMRLGTLLHLCALEPDRFRDEVAFVPADAPERPQSRSVNAKNPRPEVLAAASWWATFDAENIGREMVTRDELAQLEAMRDALMRHPSAGKLLAAGGPTEASLFWRDGQTGVRCRARVDRIHSGGQFILDIKKTAEASAAEFSRAAWNYRYDAQAAFYLDGYRALTGVDGRFIFLCQESEPPYLTACYVATPEMIEAGRRRYRLALNTYAACVASEKWPGYADAVMPLDLPAWASRSLNPNT